MELIIGQKNNGDDVEIQERFRALIFNIGCIRAPTVNASQDEDKYFYHFHPGQNRFTLG
jgi:hypothetical protein